MTSPLVPLTVTSHPVAMSVMRNGTICTTSRKKARGKNSHFRACTEHTSVTDVTSGHVRSGSLPITSSHACTMSQSSRLIPPKYGLLRPDILFCSLCV
jgi:hypothetical protein